MTLGLGKPIARGQGVSWWARIQTIDQFAKIIPYGKVQVLQLDTNSLEANLGFYAWDGLEILFGQSSAPLQVQGDRSPDSLNLNLSLSSHTDCRIAQGYRVSHLTVGGLQPGGKINVVLPAQMVYASLRISRQLLRNYLTVMQRFDLEQVLEDHHFLHLPQTLPPVIAYLEQFRQVVLEQPEWL